MKIGIQKIVSKIVHKIGFLWKKSIHIRIIFPIFVFITLINIVASISKSFSDWYTKNIFQKISVIFSNVTGLLNFSIGEIMIILGISLLIFTFLICILSLFIKKKQIRKCRKILVIIILYALVYVYTSETMNCYMLYHTTTIEEKMMKEIKEGKQNFRFNTGSLATNQEYRKYNNMVSDDEKLLLVYNEIATNLNDLSLNLKRDDNGNLVNDYNYDDCKKALKNVSEMFPLLKASFPNPKKIYNSDFMSQQYLAGIYFPFSLEANYNKLMYPSNFPSTICHELSHLKGYIREDEANFISFIACIHSENDFVKYSGYLGVLNYIMDDLNEYLPESDYDKMVKINEYVAKDNIFLTKEDFEKVEKDSLFSTDMLSDATDAFLDKNLKLNGIKSGMDNYSEVVRLIILYYQEVNLY